MENNRYIYKYIPLKYVHFLLSTGKLYFNKVTNWEDPYENFFQRQSFKWNTQNGDKAPFWPEYYGMCWTSLEESDSMWRIYSVKTGELCNKAKLDEIAIKIKVKSKTIEEEIKKCILSGWTIKCKDVIYTKSDEIDCALKDVRSSEGIHVYDLFMQTLFVKRDAFKHECEYRMIIQIPQADSNSEKDKLLIPFNKSVIQEFVIDPRLSDSLYHEIEKRLLVLGVPQYKIKKSKLYSPIEKYTFVVNELGFIRQSNKH